MNDLDWLPGAHLLGGDVIELEPVRDPQESMPEKIEPDPGQAPAEAATPIDAHIMAWAGLAEESQEPGAVQIASIDHETRFNGDPLPAEWMTRQEFFAEYFNMAFDMAVMIPPHLHSLAISDAEKPSAKAASDGLYNLIDRAGGGPLILKRGNHVTQDVAAILVFVGLKYQMVRLELAAREPAPAVNEEPAKSRQEQPAKAASFEAAPFANDPAAVIEKEPDYDPAVIREYMPGEVVQAQELPAHIMGLGE